SITVNVTPEQIQTQIIQSLLEGYQEYLQANAIPDASQIAAAFLEYLQSQDGQQRLYESVAASIDLEGAEKEFSARFEDMGGTIREEVSGQISAKMNGVMSQMSSRVESAIRQIVSQIGSGMASAIQEAMGQMGENMENAVS